MRLLCAECRQCAHPRADALASPLIPDPPDFACWAPAPWVDIGLLVCSFRCLHLPSPRLLFHSLPSTESSHFTREHTPPNTSSLQPQHFFLSNPELSFAVPGAASTRTPTGERCRHTFELRAG